MLRFLLPALLALSLPVANAQQAKAGKKSPAPFRWVAPMENAEWARKILPEGVRHATFRSPSMDIEVGYYLYLPPGYESGTQRYPVVYHLHGGRPGAENKAVRLATFIDTAIRAGQIEPTIYVFPNGGPVSWYDMTDRPNALGETVFVKELIPHIDRTWRTWGTREGRALEGYSQGGRGATRILFKHPELFLSGAPGGSGYGPERTIRDNEGRESENLRILPLGYNTWDLAEAYAARPDRPALSLLLWDGTKCFNYADNLQFSEHLKGLGIEHGFLSLDGIGHSAVDSYEKDGLTLMRHHQKTFAAHRPKP